MRRRRDEKSVRDALRSADIPDAHRAEERSRQVMEAAFAEREPAARSNHRVRAAALGVMALAIGAIALTPAGAEVRDWIADRVDDPGEEKAEPRLTSLPAPGSILVEAPGGTWVVRDDGSRRRLGDYQHATWSPNGRFIGVSEGREVSALDPLGEFRWSITAPAGVSALDWSPDEGFRVAYLAGGELRVVAGDGFDDTAVGPAESVAPAWKPESDPGAAIHELTYVDRKDRVVLRDTDAGRAVWRTAPFAGTVEALSWSADGERLLVDAGDYKAVLGATGQPLLKGALAEVTGRSRAAFSPSGNEVATVVDSPRGAELVAISTFGGRSQTLYRAGPDSRSAEFDPPVFSPDGEWILLPWRAADQWLFIRLDNRRVSAVADITRQFESAKGQSGFPRIAGWCCTP